MKPHLHEELWLSSYTIISGEVDGDHLLNQSGKSGRAFRVAFVLKVDKTSGLIHALCSVLQKRNQNNFATLNENFEHQCDY